MMRKFTLVTVLALITISITNGQTRCDTVAKQTFVITEEMPTPNISYEQFEEILNSSIDINKYQLTKENIIYISFIINCRGETLNYESHKSIDEELDNELISIVKSYLTWSPAKQRNQPVDFSKTIGIRIEDDKLIIVRDKEPEGKKKRSKRKK